MGYTTVGCLVTLILSLLVAPCTATAQQSVTLPRIGVLSPGSPPPPPSPTLDAFRQSLRDLGYVEGQTILLEYRYAEGKLDRFLDLAADLVRLRPDVIATWFTLGVQAVQQATTTIPIVSMGAGLLVEQGLVASLEHPGGTITGVESSPLGLSGKRLEILKEAVPQLSRVAFLFNPTNPFWKLELPGLETDVRALGLQLQHVTVRHPDEFDAAFAAIVESHTDALFIPDEGMFYPYLRQIMNFAATHRLPTVGGNKRFAEAGSLIAYGYDLRELAQRAAVYVDKILKGARPGDLPIERAMKFELIINLTTAQALGLTLSPVFLFRADEVIK